MTELNLYGEEAKELTDEERDELRQIERIVGRDIVGKLAKRMTDNEGRQKHVTNAVMEEWAGELLSERNNLRGYREWAAKAARLRARSGEGIMERVLPPRQKGNRMYK